jgi:hypothetical protein
LTSLVVGARLLLLARRTRRLPELALGIGLFLLGGVDYLLNLAARSEDAESPGSPRLRVLRVVDYPRC